MEEGPSEKKTTEPLSHSTEVTSSLSETSDQESATSTADSNLIEEALNVEVSHIKREDKSSKRGSKVLNTPHRNSATSSIGLSEKVRDSQLRQFSKESRKTKRLSLLVDKQTSEENHTNTPLPIAEEEVPIFTHLRACISAADKQNEPLPTSLSLNSSNHTSRSASKEVRFRPHSSSIVFIS